MTGKAKKESSFAVIWRNFRRNKTAMLGLVIVVLLLLAMIFADFIVPYEKGIEQNAGERLSPPRAEHILGTDEYGRDVFARIIHGSRRSLVIGLSTAILVLIFGGILGSLAGFYGGRIDSVIMSFCDVMICIPALILALAIVAALGSSAVNLVIAMTLSMMPGFARITRASILSAANMDYVEAAKSYGARDLRIILKYIVPNAMGPIIVQTTMNVASVMLSAAALSYLGMGVQAPAPEWGAMLSSARDFMSSAPYLLYIPGAAILLSALAFNLVGDGLRDAMDPKLRR